MKLDAKQLRVTKPTYEQAASLMRRPIYLILDNVLDTYNIGSIFRLADAVGAAEVILCGGSERPPSSRIHRAAVGTEEWVDWSYFKSGTEAIKDLRSKVTDLKVIAVEQDVKAVSLKQMTKGFPVAVVVGHETYGVNKDVLDMVDQIVEIPMFGINKSLNVHVSLAIVLYQML